MPRSLALLLLALGALSGGCGKGALEVPEAPSRTADHDTVAPRRLDRRPRLIAPPPAYGNKVVMAKASGATAAN